MADGCKENVIEYITGSKVAGITAHHMKLKNRIYKLKESYPDEVEIIAENEDGSLYAHIPSKWVTVKAPRKMTEEQRLANAERLAAARSSD